LDFVIKKTESSTKIDFFEFPVSKVIFKNIQFFIMMKTYRNRAVRLKLYHVRGCLRTVVVRFGRNTCFTRVRETGEDTQRQSETDTERYTD
jgi:hypothetical protein